MTPEGVVYVIEKATTVLVAALVALGVPAALSKIRSRRNGNGHNHTHSTQKLEQQEMKWRHDVDEAIDKFNRALFEPEGALRNGDHNVRDDVGKVIGQIAAATAEQYRDLRSEVRTLSAEVTALGKLVAARPNCCEHCTERG